MQRIDENTFIDDTLVTCAEYQLFIDEMREQGKYYQPDHWTSYQFSKGQAHEPILGMRFSDAIVFCEWLTQREGKEWKFRLPIWREVDIFSMKFFGRSPLGHWTMSDDNQSRFVWIGSRPMYPRKLVFDQTFIMGLTVDFINAINQVHDRACELNLDHVSILSGKTHLARASELDDMLNRNLARILINDLSDKLTHARESIAKDNPDIAIRIVDQTLSIAVAGVKDCVSGFSENTTFVLDLYVDIFTLRERIAGRSPAFEGIRLVKERIR